MWCNVRCQNWMNMHLMMELTLPETMTKSFKNFTYRLMLLKVTCWCHAQTCDDSWFCGFSLWKSRKTVIGHKILVLHCDRKLLLVVRHGVVFVLILGVCVFHSHSRYPCCWCYPLILLIVGNLRHGRCSSLLHINHILQLLPFNRFHRRHFRSTFDNRSQPFHITFVHQTLHIFTLALCTRNSLIADC